MPFPRNVRDEALVKSHRQCCVCHEFAGRSVNVHHIIQEADDGPNTIENAICLCLRCHAEAGHFNPRHPLGTKYSPDELRAHRDQWWQHSFTNQDEQLPASRGGRGGDATVGGSGVAIGGLGGGGGVPGSGTGGDGGSAEVTGDGFAMGGEGGEAGQADRGGRGGRSPFELLGVPNQQLPDGTWLWDIGRGGDGASPSEPDKMKRPDDDKKH